ncbi:hypothetical protein ACFYYP_32515 [Microbispora rosea]|uniref:hypothetical protein n=1 Tax=Microbispora rosea TaxID=58117 RepID=UPI00369467AF
MSRAKLAALGRTSWDTALEILTRHACAWADLDGFHLGDAPRAVPLTTHVWAWRDTRLLRLRVDRTECVIGLLDLDPAADGEEVDVTTRHSQTWPLGEGRVGVADEWRSRSVTLYEVAGLMPLTFARLNGGLT